MKLLPFTLSVKAGPPAIAEFGLMLVILGPGSDSLMLKLTAFEFPPPGAGLNTVTVAVPGLEMSLAGIEAVS